MPLDLGSSLVYSSRGSLLVTVLAINICLAYFVSERFSVGLFLTYLSVFIVVKSTFAIEGDQHLFPKEQ